MFAKSMLEISALALLQPPACRIESSPGADWHPGLLIIEEENLHNIKMHFFLPTLWKMWIKHMPAKPSGDSFSAEAHWGSPVCCFSDAQGGRGSTAAPLSDVLDMSSCLLAQSCLLSPAVPWTVRRDKFSYFSDTDWVNKHAALGLQLKEEESKAWPVLYIHLPLEEAYLVLSSHWKFCFYCRKWAVLPEAWAFGNMEEEQ